MAKIVQLESGGNCPKGTVPKLIHLSASHDKGSKNDRTMYSSLSMTERIGRSSRKNVLCLQEQPCVKFDSLSGLKGIVGLMRMGMTLMGGNPDPSHTA